MTAATLFSSVLGAQFAALDPCLRWVHSGESRSLRGRFTESDASIQVISALGGPWRMFNVARIVPRRWRDALYQTLARNRYRWFGRRSVCYLPR
jgi:predicted DCC family thiol-disulfide oxidoreductase YuxK